jgi:hypothetical protein
MKEFTKEMLDKLTAANDSVRGTSEYTKYHMQSDAKTDGRWHFIGWSIPHSTGMIKTFKDKTYIITEFEGITERYFERYEVRDSVKELLGI